MKTAILTVGTEILFGQITNTNTVYLSQQLQMMGYDVMYHHTVGDNPKRLATLINEIFKECDLIITTGGLGPTQDDLTKETVCEALHDELCEYPDQIEILKGHFARTGRTMTENNIKQAWFPSRAVIFDNDCGTAPGFALSENGKTVISMPGPPREMTRMFERRVRDYLAKMQDSVIYYKLVKTFGIGESALETVLLPLIDGQSDPTIATYAKDGETYLRVASKRKTEDEAKLAVYDMIEKIKGIAGEYVYSCEGESYAEVVTRKLNENGLKISSAESCTGGAFANALTDIPGASKIFDRSFVTYSNEAKMKELCVKAETLEKHGAVSMEVALEMVRGVKNATNSDVCVAVTGVAGPDSDDRGNPVGLCYIAVAYKGNEVTKEVKIRNNGRAYIKNCAVLHMMNLIDSVLD